MPLKTRMLVKNERSTKFFKVHKERQTRLLNDTCDMPLTRTKCLNVYFKYKIAGSMTMFFDCVTASQSFIRNLHTSTMIALSYVIVVYHLMCSQKILKDLFVFRKSDSSESQR